MKHVIVVFDSVRNYQVCDREEVQLSLTFGSDSQGKLHGHQFILWLFSCISEYCGDFSSRHNEH